MSDSKEDLKNRQLRNQQRCCRTCFSLPPSQFQLGFQSFSIHDRSPAGRACCVLEEHKRLVQRLHQQYTSQRTKRQEQETRWKRQIPGLPRLPCDLQRQAHRQRRQRWHDHQRQQQTCWREHQAEGSAYTEVPVLPAALLPAPFSSIALPQNANEANELPPGVGWQQQQLPQRSRKESKVGEAREVKKAHSAASAGQGDRPPAGRKVAELAAVKQQQQEPPVQQCPLGRGDAIVVHHIPELATARRRRKDGIEEAARHQVAGRFQVIKRLRHPHLCAYTHMLRKGRRVYVISEYWSLSLADLLNEQLQPQMRSRWGTASSTDVLPCRCSSSAVSLQSSSGGNSSSGSAESRSIASIIVNKNTKRYGDDDRCCNSTGKSTSCSGGKHLPLMSETFLRRVVRQILSALEYLNSNGIVHARLSLSAIRLDAEGNVRVADWGLQYLTAHGHCSPHTQVNPPLPFVPPEVLLFGPPPAAGFLTLSSAAVAATSAVPTGSAPAFAGTCFTAGAASPTLSPGSSARPAVVSGIRSDLRDAPETAAAYEKSACDVRMGKRCWLHSTTGDVFSVGIILLYLLQGPPRTPLPQELLEILKRQPAKQQQQHEGLLLTFDRQTTREAEKDKEQQHGQAILERHHGKCQEPRKQTEDQHKALLPSQDCLAQQEQQQMATEQQPNGQQRKQQATSVQRQHDHKENEKRELEKEKDTKLCIQERRSPVEGENSMQHLSGGLIYRPSPEKKKEGEGGKAMSEPENGALYWNEWEGCERTSTAKSFRKCLCSSQSELSVEDVLHEAACCLYVLRHVERVALLLLYVHCGYEGAQRSLPFLASAWQKETRARMQDELRDRCRDRKEEANELSYARATATSAEGYAATTWEEEGRARLTGAPVACSPRGRAIIGSCIGQGIKQFWRQQQHQLVASLRNLLRGSCSATFQSDTYETLLKIMCRYLRAQELQQSLQRQPAQQTHLKEMVLTRTGRSPIAGHETKTATWQMQQQSVEQPTWHQTTVTTLAPSKDANDSTGDCSKQPEPCFRFDEAEDALLAFVLSAAVDWLSGTNIWSALFRTPAYNTTTASVAPCLRGDSLCTTEVGVQTSASAFGTGKIRGERVATAARREEAITGETAGVVSVELQYFLRMCLALSPNDRPTPAEALNSAWLQDQHDTPSMQEASSNPHAEQQRHPRKVPLQQGGQPMPCSTGLHGTDANLPSDSRAGTTRAKKTQAARWCPQPTAAAVGLLQKLHAEEELHTSATAELTTSSHETDGLTGGAFPVNLQTMLQQNYDVPVEEVFYWWQLLGYDVHTTLTSMGAFRPVSPCLRLPLAALQYTETSAPVFSRAASAADASGGPAVNADDRATSFQAVESGAGAAIKVDFLQQTGRRSFKLCAAGGASWTRGDDAHVAAVSEPADTSSRRERLDTRRQRRRVPFLLPFANLWGQLHGPTVHDSNASGTTDNSSTIESSSTIKSNGSSETKRRNWKAPSPLDTLACCCTRDESCVLLSSPGVAREPAVPADLQQQVYTQCRNISKRREASDSAGLRTASSFDIAGLSHLEAGKLSAGTPDRSEKWTSLSYNAGGGPALSVVPLPREYPTMEKLIADQGDAAQSGIRYTEEKQGRPGDFEDGSVAVANEAEASSFFACGLREESRKWSNIGFIWKEGDARIQGVELADVVRALEEADRVPLSKAEEIRAPCVYMRQRHFLYQRLRVRHFRLLLARLPTSLPRLMQEATVDIPPVLRSQIWAALLHLNYAAEVAAGPFLFDQLMLEASNLPAVKQLDTVKFFGCHEVLVFYSLAVHTLWKYHDVLGSSYGSAKLRRLLQAFFVRALSPSQSCCISSAPSADSSRRTAQPPESFSRSSSHPFGSIENPSQKTESSDNVYMQPSRLTPRTRDDSSCLQKSVEPTLSEAQWYRQFRDDSSDTVYPSAHTAVLPVKTHAIIQAAPEQVLLSAQGFDALAAPFLLLYENHPQLALRSLEHFLLRGGQHQPLLAPTSCGAPSTVECEANGEGNQDYGVGGVPSVQRNIIAASAAVREGSTAGKRKSAVAFTGWNTAAASALQNQVQCYSQLLAFVDPVLAAHLSKRIGLKPEVYVVPWLITSFSHALELAQLYLLWDVLLLRPPGFILCVAVCLVHFLRVPLLKLGMDDELAALSLLQNASGLVHIPALSAAAVALQDATPRSILSSPHDFPKPTQTVWLPPLRTTAAGVVTPSFSSSPEPAASSHTQCICSGSTPLQVEGRARPFRQGETQRHERQTHQHWTQQQQRLQQFEKMDGLAGRGGARAPQPPRSVASGFTGSRREYGYTAPSSNTDENSSTASGDTFEAVAGGERIALRTELDRSGQCRTPTSMNQNFHIGSARTRQNIEEEKQEYEKVQDAEDASDSGRRWHITPDRGAQDTKEGRGFVCDVLQGDSKGKSITTGQDRLKGGCRGDDRRFQRSARMCRSKCEKGRPLSVQSSGGKDAGRETKLPRSHGDTPYIAGKLKHGAQARARAFVAAVIRGPAMMLVGPPRKMHRQDAVFKNLGGRSKTVSSSARSLISDDAKAGVRGIHVKGEAQRTSSTRRVDGETSQQPEAAREPWNVERQEGNARVVPRIWPVSSPELRNAWLEPGESPETRNSLSPGFPSLTLEDYLHYTGATTVLDVRPPTSFAQIHLTDAVNLSPQASSTRLLTALESAAAAAAAIQAPFPTTLLKEESSGSDEVQSSRIPRGDTMESRDACSVSVEGEKAAAELGRKTAVIEAICSKKPSTVAPWEQAGLEDNFALQIGAPGRSTSERQPSTAHRPDRRSTSLVSGATSPLWATYENWPTIHAQRNTQPSQPWLQSGMQRLHLVVVMGSTTQSATKLASRLRDSGVPHVCILRHNIGALLNAGKIRPMC